MVPDLTAVIGALTRGGVRFVVIGGVAVAAHGYLRTTADVDLVPDPDHANLDALVNVLIDLQARLALSPTTEVSDEHRAALRRGRNISVVTSLGDLDIVQRLPGVPPYEQLDARAEMVRLAGTPLRICSLADLRAMKKARGSAQDLADLERLPDVAGS
jgi:hypothetical protein